MSNDDLKKQEGDFATNWGNPMEGDSKSIIQNLQLLKQAVLIDTNKNLDDSYDNKKKKIAGTWTNHQKHYKGMNHVPWLSKKQ